MISIQTFDVIPVSVLFFAITTLSFLASELGFLIGKWRYGFKKEEETPDVSTLLGAALALLAFFLAITFNMAASRYEERKQLVLDEANAIETTYLRATLVPEPYRTEIQSLLRKYVNVRAEVQLVSTHLKEYEEVNEIIVESEKLHKLLWTNAENLIENDHSSAVTALFINSLNEVIDLHGKRVSAGITRRMPVSIFITLYFVAFLCMTMMGYQSGLKGKRTPIASFFLILTFAVVLSLIADLERPQQKIFSVSQQNMVDLQNKLGRNP